MLANVLSALVPLSLFLLTLSNWFYLMLLFWLIVVIVIWRRMSKEYPAYREGMYVSLFKG